MDDMQLVSVPIKDGRISMTDLRDFVEATDDAPGQATAAVLPDELQYDVTS